MGGIAAVVATLLSAGEATGTTCSATAHGPERLLATSHAVLEGTVTSGGDPLAGLPEAVVAQHLRSGVRYDFAYELAVERAWKGVSSRTVSLRLMRSTGQLKVGERYVVYAESWQGFVFISPCSHVVRVRDAAVELAHLSRLPTLTLSLERPPPPAGEGLPAAVVLVGLVGLSLFPAGAWLYERTVFRRAVGKDNDGRRI
ncbi:MAG: hypothetical protein HYV09_14460 [Deltaproteobacteria bacterium]|nr:hypothetical protein [Deltaproteobacteria bacterium]